ncbi:MULTISPECIES: hypothetical protein [Delftia]|nr:MULTISPECIES: hypothetical protein [Delftia]MPT54307.1 hypothetical protein [Delftia sp.]
MSKIASPLIRVSALRTLKFAFFTIAISTCYAANSQESSAANKKEVNSTSRAEVMADLALWRRAGVDRYEVLSTSYGMESEAYRLAHQEYLRLRNGEEFQEELKKAITK